MKVAILLASYNGEKYIRQQLDSLLKQTFENIVIFIRDDGSSDQTQKIEQKYKINFPDKIKILEKNDGDKNGSKYNFWELCIISCQYNFDYFMFCDQDDVWNPDKVELTLNRMIKLEEKYGNIPLLVHTDLEVVDQNLNVLGESFVKYRALNPQIKAVNKLLVQNNITGCTMMVNRKLLVQAININDVDFVAMHDWWFALVAALFGKISFIDKATIKYRQHYDNVVGATKVNTFSFIIKRLTGSAHVRETLHMSVLQAKILLKYYDNQLPSKSRKYIEILADIERHNKIKRIATVLRYNLLKQGFVQIIGELMFI